MNQQEINQLNNISYTDLQQKLSTIPDNFERNLLKTIYACCARVGEITIPRYKTYKGKGLMGKDIEITSSSLIFTLLTEKRNIARRVPISRIDVPTHNYFKENEAWLTEDIINYVKHFDGQELIFPRSTRWAEKVFEKYFGEFGQRIHLLRHWRTTHLLSGAATGMPVPMGIVSKIGGWKGTSVLSSVYDSSIIEDYWGI